MASDASPGHVVLANTEPDDALATVRERVLYANAYLGSEPNVEVLKQGAQVVVTGRSTDRFGNSERSTSPLVTPWS